MVIEVLDPRAHCSLIVLHGLRAHLSILSCFHGASTQGLLRPVLGADRFLQARCPYPSTAALFTPLLLQVQNLGFFPIHGVMMKITVPIATRGGNRLLMLRDFFTDQVAVFPKDHILGTGLSGWRKKRGSWE